MSYEHQICTKMNLLGCRNYLNTVSGAFVWFQFLVGNHYNNGKVSSSSLVPAWWSSKHKEITRKILRPDFPGTVIKHSSWITGFDRSLMGQPTLNGLYLLPLVRRMPQLSKSGMSKSSVVASVLHFRWNAIPYQSIQSHWPNNQHCKQLARAIANKLYLRAFAQA